MLAHLFFWKKPITSRNMHPNSKEKLKRIDTIKISLNLLISKGYLERRHSNDQ
jgi:hypothetical protein